VTGDPGVGAGDLTTATVVEAGPAARETPPGGRRQLILRGGLWTAASQLLPSVGVAGLSVVAARLLGADALGRQSLIAYVNSALGMVVVSGLSAAALRRLGALQGTGHVRQLARLGAWVVRAHAVAATLVFAVLVGVGLLLGRDRAAWTIIGFVTVLDAVVSGISVRVAVRQGWAEIGRLQLVAQFAGPPLGIVAVVIGFGIPGIFAGDGIAAAALLAVVWLRFGRTFPPAGRVGMRPPVPIARDWALFSLSELVTQVVARRAEFVVLAVVSTDRQIATYSVAFMLVSLMAQVPSSVALAALPVVAAADARGEHERGAHHLRLAVRVGTLLSIPLAGLVAALGPPAIELVYGSRYAAAARLVPLAGVVLLVAVSSGVCGQYWSGRGKLGAVLGFGAVAGIVDLAVAFAVAPSLGATGAVIANICGQAIAAIGIVGYTIRRLGGIGWAARSLLAMTTATGLSVGVAVAVVRSVRSALSIADTSAAALVELVAAGLAGVVVFAVTAWLLKVLTADEADWIAPLLPRPLQRCVRAVAR
jgi:O-antigen/teichoic acid export membrane protein